MTITIKTTLTRLIRLSAAHRWVAQMWLGCVWAWVPAVSWADTVDAMMNESVVRIPSLDNPNISLVTTVYKPNGSGPFPLLIMNHGTNEAPSTDPSKAGQSQRVRHYWLARTFVERGYMVASPMRQGVGGSGGVFNAKACDIAVNGYAHAQDIEASLQYFLKQPYVNTNAIVVAGQSHGGLATLALLARNTPAAQRVKAALVFSGGLYHANPTCPWAPTRLVTALGAYGSAIAKGNNLPSLWLYSKTDQTFAPDLVANMLNAFVTAGAKAQFVSVLPVDDRQTGDHSFIRWRSSVALWWPLVEPYLQRQQLPTRAVHTVQPLYPERSSGFAALTTLDPIPTGIIGKANYQRFLNLPSPRAFVLGAQGESFFGSVEMGAIQPLLNACEQKTSKPCKVYAVDDAVVYTP